MTDLIGDLTERLEGTEAGRKDAIKQIQQRDAKISNLDEQVVSLSARLDDLQKILQELDDEARCKTCRDGLDVPKFRIGDRVFIRSATEPHTWTVAGIYSKDSGCGSGRLYRLVVRDDDDGDSWHTIAEQWLIPIS